MIEFCVTTLPVLVPAENFLGLQKPPCHPSSPSNVFFYCIFFSLFWNTRIWDQTVFMAHYHMGDLQL